MNIDFYIFQQINGLAFKNTWLDSLAIFFAEYLGYFLILFLLLLLVYPVKSSEAGILPKAKLFNRVNFKKYRPMVLQAFLAGIISRLFITEIIRFLLPKPRPYVENHVNLLLDSLNQNAFPSGHAAFYFALSSVIYFYNKKIGIGFFFAAFLISISRVFCGVHWPLDILAGAVVGIFSGWLVFKILKKT